MMTPADRAAIRDELGRLTRFPWTWGGSTDDHSVSLDGYEPGIGVCEVLSTLTVERDADGPEAQTMRGHLADMTEMSDDEIDEAVQDWAFDDEGSARTDERLALTDEQYIRRNVEGLVVFKVARSQGLPDDTPRSHPKVYRSQIVDVRNVNGRFIAAAPTRIAALLDLVDEQDRQIAELQARLDAQPTPPANERVAWVPSFAPPKRPRGPKQSNEAKDYAQLHAAPGSAEFSRLAAAFDLDPDSLDARPVIGPLEGTKR